MTKGSPRASFTQHCSALAKIKGHGLKHKEGGALNCTEFEGTEAQQEWQGRRCSDEHIHNRSLSPLQAWDFFNSKKYKPISTTLKCTLLEA